MKAALLLTFIFISLCMIACGKKKSGAEVGKLPQISFEPEGIYSATIYPINTKLAANLKGVVTISKYGDYLDVRIKVKNGPSGTHMQGLYAGEACPYEDSNGDGYIDIIEAGKNINRMLIPFDGDISAQTLGNDYFPSNNYAYERSTSYALMLSDLKPKDRSFHLEGRAIVIHGVPESHSLPDSVSTSGEHSRQKSIPIACGVLSHVAYEPEEEAETTPIRVRPRPHPDRPYEPGPVPEPHRPRTYWERMRDRLERWWNRLGGGWRRGRHDEDEGEKP